MAAGTSSNLDFLRSVAVLLVLAQHLSLRTQLARIGWVQTDSLGLFGVLLFFVHTSLVLMWSMERSGLRGGPLLKDFYVRRVFRIYPLSVFAIVVAVALHLDSNVNGVAGLSYGALPSKLAIASQLLLVQNLVHIKSIVNVLWSLPFEVQMYLFLPVLFIWARRRRAFFPLLALWAVSLFGAWISPHRRTRSLFLVALRSLFSSRNHCVLSSSDSTSALLPLANFHSWSSGHIYTQPATPDGMGTLSCSRNSHPVVRRDPDEVGPHDLQPDCNLLLRHLYLAPVLHLVCPRSSSRAPSLAPARSSHHVFGHRARAALPRP